MCYGSTTLIITAHLNLSFKKSDENHLIGGGGRVGMHGLIGLLSFSAVKY